MVRLVINISEPIWFTNHSNYNLLNSFNELKKLLTVMPDKKVQVFQTEFYICRLPSLKDMLS